MDVTALDGEEVQLEISGPERCVFLEWPFRNPIFSTRCAAFLAR